MSHRVPLGVMACCSWLLVTLLAANVLAQSEDTEESAEETAGADEASDSEASQPEEAGLAKDPFADSEEEEAAPEEASEAEPPKAAGVAVAATASAQAPAAPVGAAAPEAEEEKLATFETLGSSAFPVYKTRGIPGGSLAEGMHGLQWPYLPNDGESAVRIGFSGSAWVDTSYQTVKAGARDDNDVKRWIQQGRMVLRFSPTYSTPSGWFIQAQGEAVLNNDQTATQPLVADADDLYLKVGKWKLLDFQVGRFQAWEVYHLGMGLDLNTFERRGAETVNNIPQTLYSLSYAWDRPSGVGNVAVHLYPTDFIRVELLGQLGSTGGLNTLAARPVAIIDLGFVKLKGGAEYAKLAQTQDVIPEEFEYRGGGGQIQFVLDPWVEAGGGIAQVQRDHTDRLGGTDEAGSYTTTTFGGFINGRPFKDFNLGVGLHATRNTNLQLNPRTGIGEEKQHLQGFGAVQYRLWERLTIKAVVAYARATYNYSGVPHYDTEALSGRLRFMMPF